MSRTTTPDEKREDLLPLRRLGVTLIRIELPPRAFAASMPILFAESASAFDDDARRGKLAGVHHWPEWFNSARFLSAVDYIRAQRVRTIVIREMQTVMRGIDAYVNADPIATPSLTGQPTIALPAGFRKHNGVDVPTSITFTGRLHDEENLLALALRLPTIDRPSPCGGRRGLIERRTVPCHSERPSFSQAIAVESRPVGGCPCGPTSTAPPIRHR